MMTEMAVRAGLSGGIAAVGSSLMGESFSTPVNFFGLRVPAPIAVGGAVAGASVTADLAHLYLLPYVPFGAEYGNLGSAALGMGVAGAGTVGIMTLSASGRQVQWLPAAALGAGSYLVGDYAATKFFGQGSHLLM